MFTIKAHIFTRMKLLFRVFTINQANGLDGLAGNWEIMVNIPVETAWLRSLRTTRHAWSIESIRPLVGTQCVCVCVCVQKSEWRSWGFKWFSFCRDEGSIFYGFLYLFTIFYNLISLFFYKVVCLGCCLIVSE